MDLIIAGLSLLLFTFIVPTLIAFVPLKVYFSVIGLVAFVVLSYLWLIEKLAPSESQSRRQATLGLLQVYLHTGDLTPAGANDGITRAA